LPQEQKKSLLELEQSGANKEFVKSKILACINKDYGFMFMMDENRVFHQNNEIPFDQLQYDKKLSEGGYGIVYRGKWKYTTVAIKEIKKEIIE
jgi:serine/threonine protein kinase